MKYLKDVKELDGVKVLMRVDFNVPIKDGLVADDFRIRKILPTISYLQEKKAKIILISHIETNDRQKISLEPVVRHLKKLGVECVFEKNYRRVLNTENQTTLLENLRFNEGEEKNNKKFARELASLGDIYINEAFAMSHRSHASVSAITEFIPSYAGFLFEQEIRHLSTAFNPDHPFLFILGGAKFETKLPLIEKFMKIADKVFIGGALANDFFREQGKDVGTSMVSKNRPDLKEFLQSAKLLLPIDTVIKDRTIVDAGAKTIEALGHEIAKVKYVLWNGPLGAYEIGYKESTLELAKLLADATKRGVKTIVGGGDTLAVMAELKIEDEFTFVSTGGGAMLEFLAKGTLPGIEALERQES